jgi:outer membrane lipoprotein-sorting protein
MNKKRPIIKVLKSYASLCTCVAFIFCTSPSFSKNLAKEYSAELSAIETYLNNIKNLSADFTQKSDGSIIEGKFYLARNPSSSGKMRIEYSSTPKILIVVNGSVLSYLDVELDEISRLSTNATPASLLTRPKISFTAKDVEITNIKKSADEIKISVMKKNRKEAGEFSLIFKNNPLEFTRMEVKNDLDQIIAVTLKNIDFHSEIPNKLFILKTNNLN